MAGYSVALLNMALPSLIRRILLGAVMITALVGLMALDAHLWQDQGPESEWAPILRGWFRRGGPSTIFFALLVALACREMAGLCRRAGHNPAASWATVVAIGFLAIPWMTAPLVRSPGLDASGDWRISAIWLLLGVLGTVVILVVRADTQNAVGDLGATLLMIVYLGFLAGFAVRLRCQLAGPTGGWLILLWLAVVKSSDIGGYLCGASIGRRRLLSSVSPNKTLEGLAGGLLLATTVAVVLGWFGPTLAGVSGQRPWLTWSQALVFGPAMAFLGQLGDLTESLVKRNAAAKDSGQLIPEFGGVLDLIDSPLVTAPAAWWLLTLWHRAG